MCSGVSSAGSSGSSQGSQSNCSLVNATGAVWGGGCRMLSGISIFLLRRGREHAQADDGANLIRQEGDQLRERDDRRGGPSGLQQALERIRGSVAWVEDQHM